MPSFVRPLSARRVFEQQKSVILTSSSTRDVARRRLVTEDDIAGLPEPVWRFVRRGGVIGQPMPTGFHAHITGRIRTEPGAQWSSFVGEQVSTYDGSAPRRLFFIKTRLHGVPVDVFHHMRDGRATMTGDVLGTLRMVDAAGAEMDQSETVTVFNDLLLLLPGALPGAPVTWEPINTHQARGTFTAAGCSASAVITVNDHGDMIDFVSDDRLRASADGSSFVRQRWSTPVTGWATFGQQRSARQGRAVWTADDGDFAYVELHVERLHTW